MGNKAATGRRTTYRQKSLEVALLEDHGFVYSGRKFKDIAWLILYTLFMLFILAAGITAVVQKNPMYKELINPSVCEQSGSWLKMKFVDDDAFAKVAYSVLAITTAGALLLGIAFVWLFSFCPWIMVSLTFVAIFIVPAAVGTYSLLVLGKSLLSVSISLIVVAVVLAVIICCLYTVFPLVVKLLDKASDCLMEQPGIIGMCLLLILAAVGLVWLILFFLLESLENGQVVIESCEFKQHAWARAYFWCAVVAIVWNVLLVMQIKTYFIAGSAAQWYFNNEDPPAWNPTLLSTKWALSTNLGSLCFSSLFLTVLASIRAIAEKIRQESPKNWFMRCLCCCVNCVISCIANMTQFATVYMAITGDGFFKAAQGVIEILSSNVLSAFGVWWLPEFIMYSAAILASAGWGVLAYALYFQYAKHDIQAGDHQQQAVRVGVFAGCEALIILLFFVFILLNIVDALYVSMAIDKQRSRVKRSDVHEVYHSLPSIKNQCTDGYSPIPISTNTSQQHNVPII
eukprot:TRINITY_DN17076_c1_g1_i3.p1 TRINITY_DN17076_c1_g1~~TRINITY_DN17076_c1_g1_i3.p1  ORF type:complete len:537 (-),score=75.99 TRINITY_DN17076_c1_g1_i3:556-2094(-)